ncbi:unnamed protein product [Meganyctiphanes norvegica]|uniref:Uncharacterized protein n=1 Tax=Meganyctiphanes norvegica TaxID=48144 RepID=A0AAV2RAJ7_MEGNR
MNRRLLQVVICVLISSLCALSYLYGRFSGTDAMEDEKNTFLAYVRRSGIINKFENLSNIASSNMKVAVPSQGDENLVTNPVPIMSKNGLKQGITASLGCRVSVPVPDCSCKRTLLIPEVEQCQDNSINTLRYGSSSCSGLATLRGANQSVVSMSLSGTFPGEYFEGARILAQRVKSVYPGWVLRLYHHLDMKQINQREWLCSMMCNYPHVDMCPVVNLPGLGDISKSTVTVWRFSVVGDPLVARYSIRDADSPILQREVDAVNDWVKSGKCYHVMRDNYHHGVSMMGGMWGGCNWWKRTDAVKARQQLLLTRVQSSDQPSLWIC